MAYAATARNCCSCSNIHAAYTLILGKQCRVKNEAGEDGHPNDLELSKNRPLLTEIPGTRALLAMIAFLSRSESIELLGLN